MAGNIYEFQLAISGMTSSIIAIPGEYDGQSTVVRPGRATPIETGKTAAGNSIVRSQPDLYQYTLQVPVNSSEYDLMEQLLALQGDAVGTAQFADYLRPIEVSRINGLRTAIAGTEKVDSVGVARANFQGFCIVENLTANEAAPEGNFAPDQSNAFLVSYTVREI